MDSVIVHECPVVLGVDTATASLALWVLVATGDRVAGGCVEDERVGDEAHPVLPVESNVVHSVSVEVYLGWAWAAESYDSSRFDG